MKFRSVVMKVIYKESLLVSTLKKMGLVAQDGSLFDLSYFEEVSSIVGIPSDKTLKQHGIDPDKFVNDYVACIYGEKSASLMLDEWEKDLFAIAIPYKKSAIILESFLKKEQKLWTGMRILGSNSHLSPLVADWDLADVLFENTSEQFHDTLFKVIEGGESISALV